MKSYERLCCALLLCVAPTLASPAIAADSVKQADKSSNKDDDPRKFFQFHMEGITPEEAKADYSYCASLSAVITSNNDTVGYSAATGGGLLGGLMEGIQKAVEANRMQRAGLRKCMAMFGYDRYLQSETEYNAANTGPDALDKVAKAIAGPKPATERLPK